ncbi:hypothetical protein [Natrinema altunense]|uniref:Uncharacterized protein n=1 Tax=Natrinema altunense (strain JCM 12890 / CGMCC 1.3731 / AJ2) TaxID=1227494 RepID=L9ZEK8_NATA2|nr:hypothetical protein [Natrinema altunense]ELY83608.1 hypothetical protein C485_17687 [Natrinema altunense JCM 12890]
MVQITGQTTQTKGSDRTASNQLTDFEQKIVDRIREIKNSEYAEKQAEWLKESAGDFHEITAREDIEETEENIQKIAEKTVEEMERPEYGLEGEISQ